MNKATRFMVWGAVIGSLSGLAWWKFKGSDKTEHVIDHVTPVTLYTVKTKDIARNKVYSGNIQASEQVTLVAEEHGRISQIHCHAGSYVKKGELLFELDPALTDAQVAKAKAMDFAARTEWARHKTLWKENATSQSKMEQVFSQWRSAKADLEVAIARQKAMKIVAPFDGQVGIFTVSLGTHVSPQQEIARLVSSKNLSVIFNVPESEAKYVTPQSDISVLSESHDPLPVKGNILVVDPFSDPHTHTVRVKANIHADKTSLQDGAFAQVTVKLEEAKDALVVPQEAVLNEIDGSFVFVATPHENELYAVKRRVVVGVHDQDNVQIVSGVKKGSKVVIDPVGNLRHGEKIKENRNSEDEGDSTTDSDNDSTNSEKAS